MKFNLLIKKILVCILSFMLAFVAFTPEASASFEFKDPLCFAAAEGNLEEVWRLADYVDVNCKGIYGETPLDWAARNGHLEIVRWLVEEMNADVNCRDAHGFTPLHWAMALSKTGIDIDIVKCLVNHGADVNCIDERGITPLYMAAEYGNLEVAKYLVEECHANVDCRNNDGYTPLHCAAIHGYLDLGNILVQQGAFVYMPSNKGETPMGFAQRYGNFDFVQMLKDAMSRT